jgi:putative acetyltransferase
MPDVTVRTADPADAATILSLKRAAIEQLTASAYTDAQREAWAPDDDATGEFRAALEADSFQVLVAEADETLVGYGVLNAGERTIDALFVRPFWTRSGVGTRLLGQLEASARIVGCETLTAVAARNAVPFYERVGYTAVETQDRTIDGVELPFVCMRKDLDEAEWAGAVTNI